MKIKSNADLNKNDVTADLVEIFLRKRHLLLSITNSELLNLFWETGNILNRYWENKKTKEVNDEVCTLSKKLLPKYGFFFTEKNLKNMKDFASQFPSKDQTIKIAPFISWYHILILLKIKDWKAKLFYIKLMIEQDLSEKQLQAKIKLNSLSKALGLKKTPNEKKKEDFFQMEASLLKQGTLNKHTLKNFFVEPLVHEVRHLLETNNKKNKLLNKDEKGEKLLNVLSKMFEEFRIKHNNWLNMQLNLAFWEIGKKFIEAFPESIQHSKLLKLIIEKVSAKINKNLTAKQLNGMIEFARAFPDITVAAKMAYLLTWQQILILLLLDKEEDRLYYAQLIVTDGITIRQLKQKIDSKSHEQKMKKMNKEGQNFASNIKEHTSKIIKRKGNKILTSTTRFIDLGINIKACPAKNKNVFKNSYFKILT